MPNYLNPKAIGLNDLNSKILSVEVGSATFDVSDFLIVNAGTLKNVSIVVNLTTERCLKGVSQVILNENNNQIELHVDDDTTSVLSSSIPLRGLYKMSDFHANLQTPTSNAIDTIAGVIFSIMVKKIFPMAATNQIDFSDENVRKNGAFFLSDPTSTGDSSGLAVNIITETLNEFNKEITRDDVEFDYWAARTKLPHQLVNSIEFNNSVVYVMYSLEVNFQNAGLYDVYGDVEDMTGLSAYASASGISPLNENIEFVLGWKCEIDADSESQSEPEPEPEPEPDAVAEFTGGFGGMTIDTNTNTYTFPSGRKPGRVLLMKILLYTHSHSHTVVPCPLLVQYQIRTTSVDVKFRFEKIPTHMLNQRMILITHYSNG